MQYLTLFQLNNLIQSTINQQLAPSYWVVAEIGEMRINQKGHCYMEFVEKKEQQLTAKLRANLWAYDFHNLNSLFLQVTGHPISSGMKILAKVTVQFHKVYGLSLQVKDLDPSFTLGERARQRQNVIDRLKKEGIIGTNSHLPLPLVPQRIAMISSGTAAGYGDFMDQLVSNQQGYQFKVELFESVMQGEEAVLSIKKAIKRATKKIDQFDLLILIRGGGSQTDLDCFDSYELASEIALFPLPVLTGIGHLRDDTVVDIVANTKLKTPTAVAEFLINGMTAFDEQLNFQFDQIKNRTSGHLENQRTRLFAMLKSLDHGAKTLLYSSRHSLEILAQRLTSGVSASFKEIQALLFNYEELLIKQSLQVMSNEAHLLRILEAKITMANPENVLKRGYSITYLEGKVVKNDTEIKQGDELETRVYAKSIKSKVTKISYE